MKRLKTYRLQLTGVASVLMILREGGYSIARADESAEVLPPETSVPAHADAASQVGSHADGDESLPEERPEVGVMGEQSLMGEVTPQMSLRNILDSDDFFHQTFSTSQEELAAWQNLSAYLNMPTQFAARCAQDWHPYCRLLNVAPRHKSKRSLPQRKNLRNDIQKFTRESFWAPKLRAFLRRPSSQWALTYAEFLRQLSDLPNERQKATLDQVEAYIFGVTRRGVGRTKVDQVISRVLASTEVYAPAFLVGLAACAEQRLPDPQYQQWAIDLYRRVARNPQSPFGQRGAYRLALLLIAQGQLAEAHSVMDNMERLGVHDDFSLRVEYWQAYCKRELRLKEDQSSAINRDFPLSFHRILNRLERGHRDELLKSNSDLMIPFRSRKNAHWNQALGAIELLIRNGYLTSALRLLIQQLTVWDQLAQEVPLQIYVAYLFSKAGGSAGCFRRLAKLFHAHPELINRQTLELMYPLPFVPSAVGRSVVNAQSKFSPRVVDPYLLTSLIRQESAFNAFAQSPARAYGLMQLQVPTAQHVLFQLGRPQRVEAFDLYEAEFNVDLGHSYLSSLLDQYDGQLEYALAAYNAGPTRVEAWLKRYPTTDRLLFVDLIPFKETREYVSSILRNFYWYSQLYRKGESLSEQGFKSPLIERIMKR